MAGLVIVDLQGGDYAVKLVNDDMWQQILAMKSALSSSGRYDDAGFARIVAWLADEGKPPADSASMPGCPEQREGYVVNVWRCQWFVVKPTRIQDNIDGIVFVPAY